MGKSAKVWGASDKGGASQHRRGQINRGAGIEGLTKAQKRQVIAYVKKNSKQGCCQHLIVINQREPHPKYGDRVPYFERAEVPDPMQCPCQEAQRFRASLGS
jgi:hypothetical protein